MTTTTYNTQQNVVKELRKIRDQISSEIKDMTFEEERAYLDKLLNDEKKLKEIMEKGAEKARKSARETMQLVREAIGLNY